ncbi:hypothetical protein BSY19_791 [Bosea sp. RAC05]|nr:hypothetical protein BSY19_791 [Bosea sp. RAC05]
MVNVETAGVPVRSIYNPARVGTSTGRTRRHHGATYVYVLYPSGEEEPVPLAELELTPINEQRNDAFAAGRFSEPRAIARTLVSEKIRGELTDVMYSMGAGNATFYPHQFKPVLTFLASTLGRILIADEVGLGKTIEALYIWRELQARVGARRLLVVCPAALRNKWQGELRERFALDAKIVGARDLLGLAREASSDPTRAFCAIAGIESIRSRRAEAESEERRSVRADLGAFLLDHEAGAEFAPFDLVVVDEAHYLRNPNTANHQIGQMLAAAAGHLVLLTATPIQIGSENLFNLLRLVDPDRFVSLESFESLRRANSAVTRALNALRCSPCDQPAFVRALSDMAQSRFFRSDPLVGGWRETPPDLTSYEERTRIARELEERSLLSGVLTRTRKRDVIQNRVIREPRILKVRLNAAERAIYDSVTDALRRQAYGSDTVNTLVLIARQRQLASSIAATLAAWRDGSGAASLLAEELDLPLDPDEIVPLQVRTLPAPVGTPQSMEAQDTKFAVFQRFIEGWLTLHPNDKLVVFSFFRGTLRYLEKRLREGGFATALILGGMGEAKDEELARFADPNGPSILLSSEVGSEGIDLQFSRVVVNYDLPWNPMRVEQRIGRIDRLGQKSDKITVVSLVIEDTIEEAILDRLYNRIRIFEESIGDIEEILGETVDDLVIEYFRDGLSDSQMAERLEQNALAAAQHRLEVAHLEDQAPELAGSMDFILSSIQAGREAGRWIRPDDLRDFLLDVLLEAYPGSRFEEDADEKNLFRITLSPAAGAAFARFVEHTRPQRGTRFQMPGAEVAVVFEPSLRIKRHPRPETLDITHPLIGFARSLATGQAIPAQPVAAIVLPSSFTDAPSGVYVFAVDHWRLQGVRQDIRQQVFVMNVETGERLNPIVGDRLVDFAVRQGKRADLSEFDDLKPTLTEAFLSCERELEDLFLSEMHAFRLENARRLEQGRILVQDRSAARLSELRQRHESQRRSDDERRRRAAQMTQGLIAKLEADRDQRLAKLEEAAKASTTRRSVAGGLVIVEG